MFWTIVRYKMHRSPSRSQNSLVYDDGSHLSTASGVMPVVEWNHTSKLAFRDDPIAAFSDVSSLYADSHSPGN